MQKTKLTFVHLSIRVFISMGLQSCLCRLLDVKYFEQNALMPHVKYIWVVLFQVATMMQHPKALWAFVKTKTKLIYSYW